MKNRLLLSLALVLLTGGCSTFKTVQSDSREEYDPTTGKLVSKNVITTKAGSRTLWDSDSQLANWKATQTEKTQGAEVGALVQKSTATNSVEALKAIDSILNKIR